MKMKKFDKYEDYVALQKEKTEDPVRREKWIANIEKNAKIFEQTFTPYMPDIIKGDGLCLGCRTGEEVLSLRNLGVNSCIGIDLVPHGDMVLEGDVHDLQFDDGSFDFVYSNIFDHVLYPEKFIAESFRVLRDDGVLFIQLQLGDDLDNYGVLAVQNASDVTKICNEITPNELVVCHTPKHRTPHNHSLNWNLIYKKS